MTPPVSLLVFDLDGTLMDTVADLANAINHARVSFGLPPLPEKTVGSFVGDGLKKLVERSFMDTGVPFEKAAKTASDHYRAHMFDCTRLYDGVAETLPLLAFRKALVTNKPAEYIPPLLSKFGLDGRFDLAIGGATLPFLKPDPRIIDHISHTLKVSKDGIVVIGDYRTDLEMARDSGVRSVFCRYGIGHNGGVSSTWTISNFRELRDLFKA